jgi:hypothetical protein
MDVFYEVACLTENSSRLSGIALQRKWFKSADRRVIGQYLQKFIQYNLKQFNFLAVQPIIHGSDQSISLSFKTSNYIGVIPLRASDTGKQIGDFVVMPRFTGKDRFEDYIEILNLLGTEISPEVVDSLPLVSGRNFRPPLYLEAIKFIKSLEILVMKHWKKFDNSEQISHQPMGQINWNKYIGLEYKIENKLKFPVRKNILSELHSEYSEIKYVFAVCKNELLSSNTPQRIKNTLRPTLEFLEEKLYIHKQKITNQIVIKAADNPTIKNCKEQANKILNHNLVDSTAWRVDFADVFEKFVQYIFKETAKELGGKLYSNFKFHSTTSCHYSWKLKYLEPDAMYQKDSLSIFIDAKYKANLYNKYTLSDKLNEDHRHDLHQIVAYSAFSSTVRKYGFLCYPSIKTEIKNVKYTNEINNSEIIIFILGVPLQIKSIQDVKNILANTFNNIES